MNKNVKLIIGLACVSLGLTACKDDYFDQEKYDQRLKDYFPVGRIDPNHTWAVYGSAKASVSVGGSAGQNYRVAVYQENPLTTSPVTLLASANVVSGQQPANLTFSYQLADPIVYVACYDEMNRRVVQALTVSDGGNYDVNFFGAAANAARAYNPFGRYTTRSIKVDKDVSTLTLNGSEVSSPAGFFTHDTEGKFNFNTKFSNASYHDPYSNTDLTFSQGLKMEGSTKVMFTTSYYSTVTIVQSSWQDDKNNYVTHSIKFDGAELSLNSAGWGNNCRVHTVANVPAGTHTITRATGEQGIFFVSVAEYDLQEVTIDPASFTRTPADFLNPTTMVAPTSVVNNVTVAQMQAYEPFTNADIDDNSHHILKDGATWTETIGGSSGGTTVSVNGNATYKVSVGDNYSNESSTDIVYNNDGTTVMATLKFGGSGNAAVATTRKTNYGVEYTAKVTRPYYLFTPKVNSQINFEIDDTYNGTKNFVVFDQTTNSQVSSTLWYQGGSCYIGNLNANHTYRLSLADDTPLPFYGLNMYGSGDITVGGEATEPTVITHTNPGDGHHYRVERGVSITEPIAVNAVLTSSGDTIFNDQVIYVEGTLNLYSTGTLNGPTIVVADGGEVKVHGTVNMSNAGRIVILSGGRLTGDDNAVLNLNNGKPCYNAGTISFKGTLNANGCVFYNNGTINVDHLTCTSTGLLTNYGSITAKHNSDAASAYNCTFVNACYMHFTEHAGIGQLFMLPNSRLDVDGYCEFNQSWQDITQVTNPNILCDRSVVNVQTAYVTNTVFQGPMNDGEFAIMKMQHLQIGTGTDISQTMNCYFDWDVTEVYNKDGGRGVCTSNYKITGDNPASNNQVVKARITKFVNEATAPASMSIDSGDCTGAGYNTNPEEPNTPVTPVTPVVETLQSYRFCYEDQFPSPGDYDFNDCVITVTPNVIGNEVTLKVSLDAVGANKQIAAAIRIVGLDPDKVISASTDFVDEAYKIESMRYVKPCLNDKGDNNVLYVDPEGLGYNENGDRVTDFVLNLFNDAHMAISETSSGDFDQYTHVYFYNTLVTTEYTDQGQNVSPREMTYTFTLESDDDAQLFNDVDNLDAFIVVQSTGRYWEIHTVPFKFDQVLMAWYNGTEKLTSYQNSSTRNYPWALQVPGTFRYPIEYQSICGGTKIQDEDEEQFGYGGVAYTYFRSWAINRESTVYEVQHWYDYIEDESVVW